MSYSFWLMYFSSFFFFFKFFKKKIMVLLSLELSLIFLIGLFLLYSFGSTHTSSFFSGMIFLSFMVIDSVFGISILILSSRNSSFFSSMLFTF